MSSTIAARRIRPFALACILVTASLIPALDYGFGPGDETMIARRDIHRSILNHTARDPDRYRWLAAAIVEPPVRLLTPSMGFEPAFDRVSTVFYFFAIAGMLWSLFACLRLWFPDDAALMAALVAACTLRITMRQHDYAPYSFLEPTFVALAFVAIVRRKDLWFGIIVALASFNRETAVFLVALYLVTSDWSRQAWIKTAIYGAIWAAIFLGVRYASGEGARYWSVPIIFRTNLSQPQLAVANLAMLLGVFWILAPLGWRHAPAIVRKATLIAPAYLVTIAVWGIWWEVRLLMPLYPIIFALALSYRYAKRDSQWPAWVLIGIFATAVAVNAFDYSVLVPQPQLRYAMHNAIIGGTASSPDGYRLLVPWLVEPAIRVASAIMEPEAAFRRVYLVFHFAALTALLASVYAYCRLWFSRDRALIGALVIGSVVHLVLRMGEYWDFSPIPEHSWFMPWSLLEPVFVSLALTMLYRRRWLALVIVVLLAGINSGFAGALSTLTMPFSTLGENGAHLPSTAINLALFCGPAVILAIAGFDRAPAFAKQAALAAVPLVLGFAAFGYWWDVRLLTPLYPLVAPLILASTFPGVVRPEKEKDSSQETRVLC